MGSPPDERGRGANEFQHEVTLTRGFWLADTACTQALWLAVMGGNPSNFKGAELPVETVDWYKVQKFLRKLGEKISGLNTRLPTEVEWEYACREGTTTAFAFGDRGTQQQVQVDGRQTGAVKSLPANPWGLYAMYGNVWVWCQDSYGEYLVGTVVDPVGDDGSDLRVLRGGSWVNGWRGEFFKWAMTVVMLPPNTRPVSCTPEPFIAISVILSVTPGLLASYRYSSWKQCWQSRQR